MIVLIPAWRTVYCKLNGIECVTILLYNGLHRGATSFRRLRNAPQPNAPRISTSAPFAIAIWNTRSMRFSCSFCRSSFEIETECEPSLEFMAFVGMFLKFGAAQVSTSTQYHWLSGICLGTSSSVLKTTTSVCKCNRHCAADFAHGDAVHKRHSTS